MPSALCRWSFYAVHVREGSWGRRRRTGGPRERWLWDLGSRRKHGFNHWKPGQSNRGVDTIQNPSSTHHSWILPGTPVEGIVTALLAVAFLKANDFRPPGAPSMWYLTPFVSWRVAQSPFILHEARQCENWEFSNISVFVEKDLLPDTLIVPAVLSATRPPWLRWPS